MNTPEKEVSRELSIPNSLQDILEGNAEGDSLDFFREENSRTLRVADIGYPHSERGFYAENGPNLLIGQDFSPDYTLRTRQELKKSLDNRNEYLIEKKGDYLGSPTIQTQEKPSINYEDRAYTNEFKLQDRKKKKRVK